MTKYEELKFIPAPIYIKECLRPFNSPPKTYGEALERDQQWLCEFEKCALQIEGIRDELGLDSTQQMLCSAVYP